jgi:hypothetical protein
MVEGEYGGYTWVIQGDNAGPHQNGDYSMAYDGFVETKRSEVEATDAANVIHKQS